MSSIHKTFMVIASVLCLLLINLSSTQSQYAPLYLYHFCRNQTTYSPNSTFQSNLNTVLSSLSSNAIRNKGFYNSSAGRVSPDIAYGLSLCRGDIGSDVCQECVLQASTEIAERCPDAKKAVIWYPECMLRYADRSFYSTMEDEPRVSLLNTADNPERARFQQLVENTMKDLATRVSSNQQSSNNQYIKGFATQMASFTSTQELYGLVQCTPDLSGANCNNCLQVAIATLPECCYGKQGGRVLIPSCNLRYEMYPFYNLTNVPPSPSPAIPSPAYPSPSPSPPTPSSLTNRHCCRNQTFYTPNSTFQSNLNTVLSSLSSNATRNKGFYNSSAGRVSPAIAYGLSLCQGDVSSDVCQECVLKASTEIVVRCPDDKEAVIWYPECMLRYADRSFYSTMEDKPIAYMGNTLDNPEQYRSQCTPDLSIKDCVQCIQRASDAVTIKGVTVRVFTPSCNFLFEGRKLGGITDAPSPVIPPPPPSSSTKPRGKRKHISIPTVVSIVAPICVSLALFGMAYCFVVGRKLRKKNDISKEETVAKETSTVKSLQFDFGTIEGATNNFSSEKKIGEGGFGEIYKGVLINGQEIAVKRLSKSSGQGSEEFKNEVSLVAKLQHRNLVRILGFCLQGVEQILIYEYIPNKSLDYILFDPEKQGQLDWSRRHKIIDGIARGLLYLHEDSRLRIVHRDVKASNILLDADMNPKISDFGMARIFQVDQTEGNTSRIVGTYGYMSPEYAMHGEFSVKSDVFSFGVLVLEMITGKKVTSFYQSEHADDLLCHAWKLVRNSTPLELVDPSLKDSYSRVEVLRCIHIGLLCVQEDVDARPSMASVLLMLNNDSVTMPLPQQPPFFTHNRTELEMPEGFIPDQSTVKSMAWSVDESLITGVYPR